MNRRFGILVYSLVMTGLLSMLVNSCADPEASIALPVVSTDAVTNITSTSATCGGNITSDGGATIHSRGVCWSKWNPPTIFNKLTNDGSGDGGFTSNITGLSGDSTYFVCAYATNMSGTAYGKVISFKTQPGSNGTVTDIDGNSYNYITIGTQVWMAENLKVTKYRDGSAIPNGFNLQTWGGLTSGAYLDYNDDPIGSNTYGRLYNWYAINDSRDIAPVGWHVPTDSEWSVLTTYLGGEDIAGGKLKETGTSHWETPNYAATNSTNFTALPGGCCDTYDTYGGIYHSGYWWGSTESTSSNAYYRLMYYAWGGTSRYAADKANGFSVRCIKD